MFLKRKFFFFFTFVLFLALISVFLLRLRSQHVKSVDTTNTQKTAENNSENQKKNLLQEPMTILLLGIDSRKGDSVARCDAVHFITFSPSEEKIIITSVPRNAHVDLPEVATESAYLANVCEERGIEAGIKEIIRISNLHPDYIIKVNFSQTLGILRLLGMPTTPTLQFLRDRTSYLRGGYQRSHNQALFLKDMILNHTQQVVNLPTPLKKIIFKMANTDNLDFETASPILNWIAEKKFWQKPEKIELVIKPPPWYKTIDLHFAASDYPTKDSWQNSEEFQDYQSELKDYLQDLVKKGEKYLSLGQKNAAYQILKTPFSQQLWLQVEDDRERHKLHFDLLRLYVLSSKDKKEASDLVSDFIAEMEVAGDESLKNQAEELRTSTTDKN